MPARCTYSSGYHVLEAQQLWFFARKQQLQHGLAATAHRHALYLPDRTFT
jgi:hypothetical protein